MKRATRVMSFRIPAREARTLDKFAEQHGLLVSDVCRTAVVGYLSSVVKIISSDKTDITDKSVLSD